MSGSTPTRTGMPRCAIRSSICAAVFCEDRLGHDEVRAGGALVLEPANFLVEIGRARFEAGGAQKRRLTTTERLARRIDPRFMLEAI